MFWGCPIFWGQASQNLHFQRVGLQMPIKRATVLGPSEEFQKSLRTYSVVLRIGYNPRERSYTSFQYLWCPNQKTKKSAVFAHFVTVFN